MTVSSDDNAESPSDDAEPALAHPPVRQATTAPLAATAFDGSDSYAVGPATAESGQYDAVAATEWKADHGAAVLERRLRSYESGLRAAFAGISVDLLERERSTLIELLDDWSANLGAQIEFLARFATEGPSSERMRSELFRASRDAMRWLRKLAERAEAAVRGGWKPSALAGALSTAIELTDQQQTLSAPLDVSIFAVVEADSWILGTRKRLAARRGRLRNESRGVPLREIAGHFALPALLDVGVEATHRAGAMRADFWRRLRAASLDIVDVFTEVDSRMAAGDAIDFEALRVEVCGAVTEVRDDLERFASDIVGRVERALSTAVERVAHACQRSDTFLLPSRVYEPYPAAVSLEARLADVRRAPEQWNVVSAATLGALGVVLDGQAFIAAVRYAHFRDAHRLREIFDGALVKPTARITERGDQALARIEAVLDTAVATDDHTRYEVVERERVALVQLLEHGCLDALRNPGTRTGFEEAMDELRRSVRRAAERVSPSFSVPRRQSGMRIVEGEPPPRIESVQFELQSLAESSVNEQVRANVEAAWEALHALLSRSDDAVVELNRMVGFNLEAARDELAQHDADVDEGLVREYAIDGLRRFVERARSVRDDVRDTADRVVTTISESVPDAMRGFEQTLRDLHVETHDRVETAPDAAPDTRSPGLIEQVVAWAGAPTTLGPTGRPDTPIGSTAELAERMKRASLNGRSTDTIPDAYWRLFADTGERDAQFRLERAGVVDRVRNVVVDWEQGDPECVALVGLRGVGKSSVLAQLGGGAAGAYPTFKMQLTERVRTEEQLALEIGRALRLRDAPDLASIDSALGGTGERFIVLVDGAENLFLRHAAGLQVMRRFLSLITASADRVLWIVSFEQVAFEFLGAVLNLSDAFTSVVHVSQMSRREIEELILIRHRVSGRRLRFDPAIAALIDDQLRLQHSYFDQLHTACFGHPLLAIHYWLESVRTGGTHTELTVSPFEPLPAVLLGQLSGQKLAGLATLMIHGALDKRSFAEAMRMSDDDAASLLGQLRHLHLAEPVPGDRLRFQVNGVAYAALFHDLKTRNVL